MMTSSPKRCHNAPRHGLDIYLVFVVLSALVCACLVLPDRLAWAQTTAVEPDAETVLSVARKQINEIRQNLTSQSEDIDLPKQRAAILETQSKVKSVSDTLQPRLASVSARLQELGPSTPGIHETHDIAAQRASLEAQRGLLDTQVKLARLLIVETAQMSEQISSLQRAQFQAKLGERHNVLISSASWAELRSELPDDLKRLMALAQQLRQATLSTPSWIWAILGSLAILAIAMYIGIGRWLLRLTATRVPPGRLRRSFFAVVQMLLSITVPGLVAELIRMGIVWNATLSDDTDAMLRSLVTNICFGAYVWGLGYALLSPERPSWRLPAIKNVLAQHLRRVPVLLGCLIVLGWLADHLPVLLNASLVTTIALNSGSALLLTGVLAYVLLQIKRAHDVNKTHAGANCAVAYSLWAGALMALLWAIVIATLSSLLVGYIAFSSFLIEQVLWMAVVLATFYVLSALIDDGFRALLGSPSRDNGTQGKSGHEQAAVLLSGIFRLALLLCALALLLAHAGEAPSDLLNRLERLREGITIGQVHIRPAALFQAILVLTLGLAMVRILKRWLGKQFLPTTELDPGMQLSATTLFGYAGIAISIALALSAVGIGLERVAWIASALSVGIGFGLQAVVQNWWE